MINPKRKKIYYRPGLISLIFLPIAFIYFSNRELERKQPTVLRIFLADAEFGREFAKDHPGTLLEYHGHYPPIRNYALINFTGNSKDDKLKLKFAALRIAEIVNNGDSQEGLHFEFGNNCDFGTFVKTIDNFTLQGGKTYMITAKDIWFYYIERNSKPTRVD